MNLTVARVCYVIRCIVQPVQTWWNRLQLKNRDFTIICGTCAGGIIYHRLGEQFRSPTVNLWIREQQIPQLVNRLRWYMEQELVFVESDYDYPVAVLGGDVKIMFNHAKTAEEAEAIWNRRKERINYNNIWVLSSDNGLTYEDIRAFGQLNCVGGRSCLRQKPTRNLIGVFP